jgi:hypothetical protein
MITPNNSKENVMTRNASNANSEALELRELPCEELDRVSGGDNKTPPAPPPPADRNKNQPPENEKQSEALKEFHRILQEL